jgi:hypothetical protein
LDLTVEDCAGAERERCVSCDGEGVRRGGQTDALPFGGEGLCELGEVTGAVVVVFRSFVDERM